MNWFIRLFWKPKVHVIDCANGGWTPENGGLEAHGCWFTLNWPYIKPGDIVAIKTRPGYASHYRVLRAFTPSDPGDQHFLDLEYVRQPWPRVTSPPCANG